MIDRQKKQRQRESETERPRNRQKQIQRQKEAEENTQSGRQTKISPELRNKNIFKRPTPTNTKTRTVQLETAADERDKNRCENEAHMCRESNPENRGRRYR